MLPLEYGTVDLLIGYRLIVIILCYQLNVGPVEFEDRSISSAPGPPLTQSRTQSRRVERSLVFVSTDSLSLASSNYNKNTRSTGVLLSHKFRFNGVGCFA
jgi:hypothetical protein